MVRLCFGFTCPRGFCHNRIELDTIEFSVSPNFEWRTVAIGVRNVLFCRTRNCGGIERSKLSCLFSAFLEWNWELIVFVPLNIATCCESYVIWRNHNLCFSTNNISQILIISIFIWNFDYNALCIESWRVCNRECRRWTTMFNFCIQCFVCAFNNFKCIFTLDNIGCHAISLNGEICASCVVNQFICICLVIGNQAICIWVIFINGFSPVVDNDFNWRQNCDSNGFKFRISIRLEFNSEIHAAFWCTQNVDWLPVCCEFHTFIAGCCFAIVKTKIKYFRETFCRKIFCKPKSFNNVVCFAGIKIVVVEKFARIFWVIIIHNRMTVKCWIHSIIPNGLVWITAGNILNIKLKFNCASFDCFGTNI